jgi:hypothetical protein
MNATMPDEAAETMGGTRDARFSRIAAEPGLNADEDFGAAGRSAPPAVSRCYGSRSVRLIVFA